MYSQRRKDKAAWDQNCRFFRFCVCGALTCISSRITPLWRHNDVIVLSPQPRSQALSSLPPLVVGRKTLVAAGHVTTCDPNFPQGYRQRKAFVDLNWSEIVPSSCTLPPCYCAAARQLSSGYFQISIFYFFQNWKLVEEGKVYFKWDSYLHNFFYVR